MCPAIRTVSKTIARKLFLSKNNLSVGACRENLFNGKGMAPSVETTLTAPAVCIFVQGEQADENLAGLTGWPDQDLHYCHGWSRSVQHRGDPLHAGLRPPGQEHHQQTRDQPETHQESPHQGLHSVCVCH